LEVVGIYRLFFLNSVIFVYLKNNLYSIIF
jgi:hypothetical protein